MNLDFSFNKYRLLIEKMIESNYSILTVKDYFELKNKLPERFVIFRHDVDSEPEYTLKIAILENKLDVKSTYYFRNKDIDNNKHIINEIFNLGHEVGYHYEVLDLTNGNYEEAIIIFEKYLQELRKICDVKTIAQHGSPIKGDYAAISPLNLLIFLKNALYRGDIFTNLNNKDIWTKYDFKDFGIIGEAYLSFDFDEVIYISDSGRSWNGDRYKIKDTPGETKFKLNLNGTDELINLIDTKLYNKLYILTHVNQWKDNYTDWIKWLIFQKLRNSGKIILKCYWAYKERK